MHSLRGRVPIYEARFLSEASERVQAIGMSLKKDKERTIFDFVYADRTFDSLIPVVVSW